MQLVVLGLNHKTVPVDIREQFAISPDSARSGLIHLDEQEGIEEAVVLSTCNRTEIYAVLVVVGFVGCLTVGFSVRFCFSRFRKQRGEG